MIVVEPEAGVATPLPASEAFALDAEHLAWREERGLNPTPDFMDLDWAWEVNWLDQELPTMLLLPRE